MPSQSPLHEAARAWAEAGFYVFPCTPGAKTPATTHGLDDATLDLNQIDQWWNANPRFNVGIAPARSGMFVLDQDGTLGAETLAALEADNGVLPPTLTIQTPRGPAHKHYWFTGECPSTVQRLGPKLDTRGAGGYVLVPPSVTADGDYDYASDTDTIAIGPEWINTEINARSREGIAGTSELDTPSAIARAHELLASYIARDHVAVEGSGGDSHTYAVCAEILNLGLSPGAAFEVLQDWNAACQPPWEDDDLKTKIENAANYAQNDQGAWAIQPAAELFAGAEKFAVGNPTSARSKFYPYELSETEAFQPPAWIIPDLIPERGTVQIAGKHKSFKTFLALDMALGIAAGAKTFGFVPESRPVVYAVGENAHALVLNHVPAWCQAREIDLKDRSLPFYVIAAVPQASILGEAQELVAAVRAKAIKPGVLVIDTATRALRGLDENSAKDMGQFSAMCEFLQKELQCTVIVIRHTGKDESRGGRGSNVIEGDFDTMLHVERYQKTFAVSLAVKEQRNAAECEVPWTFEGRRVGASLVFFETDHITHRNVTKGEDAFDPIKIGTALRELRAIGDVAAVTTHVLATHIAPQLQDESAEVRQQVVARVEKSLKALGAGRLAGYVSGHGKGLTWLLPETDVDIVPT